MATEYLWRYLTLSKYIDLLHSRSVYFPKAAKFIDRTEGKWLAHAQIVGSERRVTLLHEWAEKLQQLVKDAPASDEEFRTACRQFLAEIPASLPPFLRGVVEDALGMPGGGRRFLWNMANTWSDAEWANGPTREWWTAQVKSARDRTYISCWNRGGSSLAMWSMYCGGKDGVAVRIAAEALPQLLDDNASRLEELGLRAAIKEVKYLDGLQEASDETMREVNRAAANPNLPQVGPFVVKPKMYEFEREIRAMAPAATKSASSTEPETSIEGVSLEMLPGRTRQEALAGFIAEVRVHPELEPTSRVAQAVRALHAAFGVPDIPLVAAAINAFQS